MKNRSIIFIIILLFFSGLLFLNSNTPGTENNVKAISNSYITNPVMPHNINFAGQKVPLEKFDVREALDRELLSVANWHSKTLLTLKRANRWFPVIDRILKKNNIPLDFRYLAVAESGLINDVSPVGAKGVWQLMESTGKELGLEINKNIDERYHMVKSTEAACKYLQSSYDIYKDWVMVAASYNMGKSALKGMQKFQYQKNFWDLALYEETSRYVYRIIAIKIVMENPTNYGFKLKPSELYPEIPTRELTVDSTINELSKWAIMQGSNYKILKYFNPWLRQRYLENKEGKKYILQLPKRGMRTKAY